MDLEKGIAYCGLACCLCDEEKSCKGCKQGACKEQEKCKPFLCSQTRKLESCWQCSEFPCTNSMFDSLRIRTFVRFIQQYGEEKLLECLKRNEQQGVVYHYPNKLIGDYDQFSTETELINFLLNGK